MKENANHEKSYLRKEIVRLGISIVLVGYMTLDISESYFQMVEPVSFYILCKWMCIIYILYILVSKCVLYCYLDILLFLIYLYVILTFLNILCPFIRDSDHLPLLWQMAWSYEPLWPMACERTWCDSQKAAFWARTHVTRTPLPSVISSGYRMLPPRLKVTWPAHMGHADNPAYMMGTNMKLVVNKIWITWLTIYTSIQTH